MVSWYNVVYAILVNQYYYISWAYHTCLFVYCSFSINPIIFLFYYFPWAQVRVIKAVNYFCCISLYQSKVLNNPLNLLAVNIIQGKYDQQYERSEEFRQELKLKVRELLTEQEWRRRKMQMRVCQKLIYLLIPWAILV